MKPSSVSSDGSRSRCVAAGSSAVGWRWPIPWLISSDSYESLNRLRRSLWWRQTRENIGWAPRDVSSWALIAFGLLLGSLVGGSSQTWEVYNGGSDTVLVGNNLSSDTGAASLRVGETLTIYATGVRLESAEIGVTTYTLADSPHAKCYLSRDFEDGWNYTRDDARRLDWSESAVRGFGVVGGFVAFGFLIRIVRKIANQSPDV